MIVHTTADIYGVLATLCPSVIQEGMSDIVVEVIVNANHPTFGTDWSVWISRNLTWAIDVAYGKCDAT